MTGVVAVLGHGVVDASQPILFSDDLGLTRGDGCFDATRVSLSAEGELKVDHLDDHLDRFEASARGLDLELDRSAWLHLIEQALEVWQTPGESTLKMLLTRGREGSGQITGVVTIDLFPDLQQRNGIAVAALNRGVTSEAFRDAPWLLGGIKTTSYAGIMAAKREAKRRGADDALFLTTDGYLWEGSNSAVVWAAGGELFTTPHDGTGILRSITQAKVYQGAEADGVKTHYQLGTLDELLAADGAWLLSSIRGIAPIIAVDDHQLQPEREWTNRLNRWGGFPELN